MDNQIDDQDNAVDDPNSVGGPESAPTPESLPPKETLPSTESKPSPKIPTPIEQTPIKSVEQEKEKPPQVVDKTGTPTDTHHLEKPGDKLTKEADEEEERFIEEVEKHHGSL